MPIALISVGNHRVWHRRVGGNCIALAALNMVGDLVGQSLDAKALSIAIGIAPLDLHSLWRWHCLVCLMHRFDQERPVK